MKKMKVLNKGKAYAYTTDSDMNSQQKAAKMSKIVKTRKRQINYDALQNLMNVPPLSLNNNENGKSSKSKKSDMDKEKTEKQKIVKKEITRKQISKSIINNKDEKICIKKMKLDPDKNNLNSSSSQFESDSESLTNLSNLSESNLINNHLNE